MDARDIENMNQKQFLEMLRKVAITYYQIGIATEDQERKDLYGAIGDWHGRLADDVEAGSVDLEKGKGYVLEMLAQALLRSGGIEYLNPVEGEA